MDLRALNDCLRHRLADKRTVTDRMKWFLTPQRIPAYVLTVKTNGSNLMCMANNAFTSRPAPLGGVGPSGLGDTHDHTRSNHMDTTTTITITAWVDPLVDDNGHDPRSRYTDEFWAPVLGPSATLIGRTLAYRFDDANGASFELDLSDFARTLGLSYNSGRNSPFTSAWQRLVMFGLAHDTATGKAVRRRYPDVSHRHLNRLPDSVQVAHHTITTAAVSLQALERAHTIAAAMIAAGDAPTVVEHQLGAIGISAPVAAAVTANFAALAQGNH